MIQAVVIDPLLSASASASTANAVVPVPPPRQTPLRHCVAATEEDSFFVYTDGLAAIEDSRIRAQTIATLIL